jgi:hypothetical protein
MPEVPDVPEVAVEPPPAPDVPEVPDVPEPAPDLVEQAVSAADQTQASVDDMFNDLG